MLIIPALDLQDGCVVRFVQGKHSKKIYSHDPVKTAKHWVKQGARFLHIVDLDGAFTGVPKNLPIIKQIARQIAVPLECGGGIRDRSLVAQLLDAGIARVIVSTKAVEDKNFLKKAFVEFQDKIIVSIDAQEGRVLTKGWKESAQGLDAVSFALQIKKVGFKEVIYTDTTKDGTLRGPNIKGTKELLKSTGLKVIASGGIASLNDIVKFKRIGKLGLQGVIIGKALYEGKFTLAEALALA